MNATKLQCNIKSYILLYILYIPVFILFVSFPILDSTIVHGADLIFHLSRIESIKQGLLDGQFPVKLYTIRYNGCGDAAGFFYPDFFLYIPAILRILGFSITNSLNIFILLINSCTFFICYWSFKNIVKIKEIAYISSLIYLSFLFRLVNLYSNAAVGTYLALTFMPMVFVSFYLILTKHKNYLMFFVLSVSGVMQSHIISTFFCFIGCTVLFIFAILSNNANKHGVYLLIKCLIFIILINAWFYYPFIQMYSSFDFKIKYPEFSDRNFIRGGYNFIMSIQFFCGLHLIFLIFSGIGYLIGYNKKSLYTRYIKRIFVINFFISVFVLILCTNIIPYKQIITNYNIVGRCLSSIQFVARFQCFSMVTVSIISGISLYFVFLNFKYRKVYVLIFLSFVLILNYIVLYKRCIYFIEDERKIYLSINRKKSSDNELRALMNMFDKYYIAADYLPSDYKPMVNCIIILDKLSGEVIDNICNFNRKGVSLEFNSNYEQDIIASLPILYYPGFKAELVNNKKQKIVAEQGIFHHVKIEIPNGNHQVKVKFVGLLQWKIAELVSLISLFLLFYENYFGIKFSYCKRLYLQLRYKYRISNI